MMSWQVVKSVTELHIRLGVAAVKVAAMAVSAAARDYAIRQFA